MVTTVNNEDHARIRKVLVPVFTDNSLLKHEFLVHSYVDLTIRQFKKIIDENTNNSKHEQIRAVIDVVKWYNFCLFNIIGDLGLGEAFGSLEKSEYHPSEDIVVVERKLVEVRFRLGAEEEG
ncbi:hypothetical protein G7Y89_g4414 [Cudoniella acicularis]|uniref:Cytochrome P450 n=1 Tax=Cudoniella acicularis TaxID=354080 RepID=A0A8H4W7H2_9HELO|nr:hypothetical protein G7Y89_g4414 [Cudoniella acicularis]